MAFYLTKEDGDKILQETGDGLLLENQSSPSASISPSASQSASSSPSVEPDLNLELGQGTVWGPVLY